MKNIQDCIDKEVVIICNSFEEYKGIKTLLKEDKDPLTEFYNQYKDTEGKIGYYTGGLGITIGTYSVHNFKDSSVYQAGEFLYREEFPKTWYIENDHSDTFESVIIPYINKTFLTKLKGTCDYYFYDDHIGSTWFKNNVKKFTELSIDEFCYLISKQTKPMAGERRETKKIIGYKCPYNILHWNKGDIFKVWDKKIGYYYVPNISELLPKELVETWEPVYEDDKIIVPGSEYEVVIVSKFLTTIAGYEFKKSFWNSALVVALHSKAQVKIGCSHQFTIDQKWIESVLDAMERK